MDLSCRDSSLDELPGLWLTPDLFPIDIAPETNRLMLVPVSQRTYREASFLDDREIPTGACVAVPLDEAVRRCAAAPTRRAPVHGIFHIAFCGSTLIARCLDRLAGAMVLKEPYSLHDLAERRRRQGTSPAEGEAWQGQFQLLTTLLARTYRAGQTAIVKPTDASTNLMGEFVARSDAARALFLYVGAEAFLVALLGDEVRMGFVDQRITDLSGLVPELDLFREGRWRDLPGAQRASCLWWLHCRLYSNFVTAYPDAPCHSLDFESFLREPRDTLASLARFFALKASPGEIDTAVTATLATHSKERGRPFSASDREKRHRDVARRYRDEIRQGLKCAERLMAEYSVAMPPRPIC